MKPTDELPVIFADRVQSLNYDGPDGSEVFADAGTSIDLATGTITSTGLVVDGVTGNVFVRGSVEATAFVLDYGSGPSMVFGSYFDGFNTLPALEALDQLGAVHTRLAWSDASIFGDADQTGFLIESVQLPAHLFPNKLALTSDDSYAIGGGDAQTIELGNSQGSLKFEYASSAPGLNRTSLSCNTIGSILDIYAGQSGDLRITAGTSGLPGTVTVSSGPTSSELTLGAWSVGSTYAAVEADNGYVLLGRNGVANDAVYFRNSGTGAVHIGTNGSNDLTIANGGAVTLASNLTVNGFVRRYDTATRYMGFGLTDGSYARFETTAPNFWFPKPIQPRGLLSYDDGSAAAPEWSFRLDSNTGVFRGGSGDLRVSCNGTTGMIVQPSNFYARGVWFTATASAVDVRAINSYGQLGYFSSSLDTKTDIEPLDLDRALALIDGLEPIWYRSTNEVDRPDWSHYGFAAEHVADLDPRLVGFDDEGKPRTVAYASMVVPLVAYVRALAARVTELESLS